MARRNDHTREELKRMATTAGHKIIAKEGFSKFSARKVSKEIGYTIGTLYNIFESHNELILYINATTLDTMRTFIIKRFDKSLCSANALKNLCASYVQFSQENYNTWSALFQFNLPQGAKLPEWYASKIAALFALVEVPLFPLSNNDHARTKRAAKVLWASIHGICQLGLTGKLHIVEHESIKTLTDFLIDNFIQGIKK